MTDALDRIDSALDREFAFEALRGMSAASLVNAAATMRDIGHGATVTYSRKVFIPLTKLCRDVCHYCTFAQTPSRQRDAYLSLDEVLKIARAGAAAGCHEALFTLGDKPELRYSAARVALRQLGHDTTLSYLAEAASLVLRETGLLPHLNPGVMNEAELKDLRPVSVSMGMMLESLSERLCKRGAPHHGSPDKAPAARLATLEAAGRAAIPFTTGLLIGIGESRVERIETLLAIRNLHDRYGHIQEVIIQNFCPKVGTRMADWPAADESELTWTIAVARLILGPGANIQAPPNLNGGCLDNIVAAGINDWGGVSPVTPDHVNPELAWPHLSDLRRQTAEAGKTLTARLAVYPNYVHRADAWLDPAVHSSVLQLCDGLGHARTDDWRSGVTKDNPEEPLSVGTASPTFALDRVVQRVERGERLDPATIERLFAARDGAYHDLCRAADRLRNELVGPDVSYVVNRNINYTNICLFRCQFCAFSKGRTSEALRGRPYDLSLDEIVRRCAEARSRGATEVCLQGGIHPNYTGATYIEICKAIRNAIPDIHIHAFSPLEIWHGAKTAEMSVAELLDRLKQAGLDSLPGTAAEILDDDVRAVICPDKIDSNTWLDVVLTAHSLDLPTTSTIMFGHVDEPRHWARHLLHLRDLQERSGGITEFVPLPFVAAEAPIYLKGNARPGPTFREAILMHAVSRLVFGPLIANIQTSWVKMGPAGTSACLGAGANDLGGTLMNESITRAAGAAHGQEFTADQMRRLIRSIDRTPRQRTTLYEDLAGSAIDDGISGDSTGFPAAPAHHMPLGAE